ncbi:MAG: hypothetical protein JSV91_15995 [Phycisphaerales bacterium]|nr:MAG: hypothetical protein JSV91_15995 [Phycisphaerales bacterium]
MSLSVLWAVSGTAAVAGLCLAWWALLRDRPRGRPRCPFCWYDMRGIESLRCPECGCEVLNRSSLFRTRRRWRIGMMGLLIAACSIGFATHRHGRSAGWFDFLLPEWVVYREQTVHGFRVQKMGLRDQADPDWRSVLRIDRDGKTVFEIDGLHTDIGGRGEAYNSPRIGLGEDITGNGVPNLVITKSTGSKGLLWQMVLELLPDSHYEDVRPVALLDGSGHFQDLTGDGYPEFIAADRSSYYRFATCEAAAASPTVVLEWSGRGCGYLPAPDLMRKPPPTEEEIRQRLRSASEGDAGDWHRTFSTLQRIVLDLIYTGNESEAWRVLEQYWPEGEGWFELSYYKAALAETIQASPYRLAVEAVNRLPAPASPTEPEAP